VLRFGTQLQNTVENGIERCGFMSLGLGLQQQSAEEGGSLQTIFYFCLAELLGNFLFPFLDGFLTQLVLEGCVELIFKTGKFLRDFSRKVLLRLSQ